MQTPAAQIRPRRFSDLIGHARLASPRGRVFRAMAIDSHRTVCFAIHGPLARSDLPGLAGRVCELLRGSGAAIAFCDVRGIDPDAVAIDALARLQLVARRYGCRVKLRNCSRELLDLLAFMGLQDVLPE
jgi:ABC-type transporter Mla MlaB component